MLTLSGDHLREYQAEKKLKPENGGSNSLLSQAHTTELIAHLEASSYVNTADICEYVKEHYGITANPWRIFYQGLNYIV
jgi:transposase